MLFFAPFFDTTDIFSTRTGTGTGTGTGPKRGSLVPQVQGRGPHWGWTLHDPREGEEPPNSPKYHNKRYFPAFFDTKDLFMTRTGTGTGPGREGPRPPGI